MCCNLRIFRLIALFSATFLEPHHAYSFSISQRRWCILKDMNIYFSGIGGVGVGPLAEIAHDAGYRVQGSDVTESLVTHELEKRGITVHIGQDGSFLQACHEEMPVDWFVYTSALPGSHPELVLARQLGMKVAKRDELLAHIITEKNLKLIAIAGTHGKTTTTGMMIWSLGQLGVPISYSIGTTISFGPSGKFDPASDYFVYECDEFDRNFLHFSPYLSLITAIDYDHPDTYPTAEIYMAAFRQFINQSAMTIMWHTDGDKVAATATDGWILGDDEVIGVKLAGAHNRRNATLVAKALEYLLSQRADSSVKTSAARVAPGGAAPDFAPVIGRKSGADQATGPATSELREKPSGFFDDASDDVKSILNTFPGTDRRFEKLAENLYSDYGHHPVEIAATLQLARELSDQVVLIYQPHQNIRQHEIKDKYTNQFELADEIYWLPTYLSREDPNLPILTPEELIQNITNKNSVHTAEFGDELWDAVQKARDAGKLVLAMGAGTIDSWLRKQLIH